MSASYVIAEDRGVLAVAGDDRVAFLQGLVSNDVARVAPGQAVYSALLTAQGRYLHDFFIASHGDVLLIDVERARLPDLLKKLTLYKLRSKVILKDESQTWRVALVWGDGAQPFELADGAVFADPRLPALGVRAILPAASAEALLQAKGLQPGRRADYDALRLKLGVPDGSRDLPIEKAMLLENGFDELNGIDWKKGCYMGQELTARTKYRGLVRKRLLPVAVEGEPPPYGTPVTLDGRDAGVMRSGHDGRALALLRVEMVREAQAQNRPLEAAGAALRPEVPGWVRLPEPEAKAG